ncbi:MAG TPA: serine hydrolase domain-containing protein [Caulobacteraceae bacterium]|jgi:CubicO group peptidase (beta-lactamase class C family)
MAPLNLTRRDLVSGLAAAPVAARPAGAAVRKTRSEQWRPVNEAIDQAVASKTAPGVIAMIAKNGQTVYSRAAGTANFETATPMTLNSVCRIGSVSKQFTASAILLLAEDGKLSLDDPLARFIPEFPKADQLPLRRMLNHTAGMGNYTAVKLEQFLQNSRLDYDDAALLKVVEETKPLFLYEPGTSWRYSNNDYVLLGMVVTRAAGEPYRAFLQRRLFAPLGLSGTAVDDAGDIVPHRASGYSPDGAAAIGFRNASFISMTYPGGAGCLRSCAPDLMRWTAALLGGRVLRPQSLKAMLTPATLNDGALPIAKNAPGMPAIRYGFGLGLESVKGHLEIAHAGGIQGFYSDLRTYPDLGVTFAILINGDGIAGAKPSQAISSAMQGVFLT